MVEMTRKKIIVIVAVVVIAIAALAVVYHLNGNSLDLRDRETRIVVTNSMDGNTHPDGCYHCDACDKDWLPNIISSLDKDAHPTCPYCSSTNTHYVSHNYKMGKIPVNALIMTKKLSSGEKQSIKVGDVISFEYNNRETIHRVIQVNTDSSGNIQSLVTSGDNTSGTETTSDMSKVHGVVVGESVFLGKIVHFAQSSTILLIMMLVIIVVIISVVRDMIKMSQHNKNE